MWYENSKKSIDYSKPIFAEKDGNVYLLVEKQKPGSYHIVGYNWFKINSGEHNSCADWPTVEGAMKAYSSYDIYNGTINVERVR